MEYLTPAGEEAETRPPLGTGMQRALNAIIGAHHVEHRAAEQDETYAVGDPADGVK
jgi:hypothetical protein